MDLSIIKIAGHGKVDDEYVYIKVVRDCNLNRYALSDTSYTGEHTISNKVRHFYWFSKKFVKAGEYVSLRTGKGSNTIVSNNAGHRIHRIYWGLGTSIWNNDGDAAVLFHISDWNTTKAT